MSWQGTAPPPHIRIRPGAQWALHVGELWRYRELLMTLAGRDVKVRYKQTVLGVLWVVLQPLVGAGIFTFIFGGLAGLKAPVPMFLISFAGMQGWGLFSNTINKASNCLIGNNHLISKIYFPRLLLPGATMATTLIDFAITMAMLVVLMAVTGTWPGWPLALLPLWIVGLLMLGLGVGLITAALAVSYRDVKYVVPVVVQLLLYASPVGYPASSIAKKLPEAFGFYMLNPLAGLLEAFRWSLFGVYDAPAWGDVAYAMAVSAMVLLVGCYTFKRMERKFADVI